VRLTLGRLSAALEQACDDGKLARNPARRVKLPAEAKAERPQWTEDQVRRMLATEDRLAACWRLALYGLRRGEICGLRWADVDLDAATLTVAQTRVVVGQVVTTGPKSRASSRTLPMDAATVGELRALKACQAASGWRRARRTPPAARSPAMSWALPSARNGSPTSSAGSPPGPACRGSACTTPGAPSTR